MIACGGTADEHCCWIRGAVCAFFDPDPPADAGGHCSLRYELGSWPAVYADERYVTMPKSGWHVDSGLECGDYPAAGDRCGTCGQAGP